MGPKRGSWMMRGCVLTKKMSYGMKSKSKTTFINHTCNYRDVPFIACPQYNVVIRLYSASFIVIASAISFMHNLII
jgi:hypothetical protein